MNNQTENVHKKLSLIRRTLIVLIPDGKLEFAFWGKKPHKKNGEKTTKSNWNGPLLLDPYEVLLINAM